MFRLALPVVLTNLGLMLMALVDLVCVGRVSVDAISAVGLGTAIFAWFMIFGIGLVSGLEFLVSRASGAGHPERGFVSFMQTVWASIGIGLPLTAALWGIAAILPRLGFDLSVTQLAQPYLRVLALSLIPVYLFTAGRLYLLGHGLAWPTLVILALANVLNAGLNWLLVLGHCGFPKMGSTGSAWATTLSRAAMLLALAAFLHVHDRRGLRLRTLERILPRREAMKEMLSLGLPSALQMTFEVGAFAFATTLAARLNPMAQAAHQVTLNIASLTFMVPLGISSATAVLVGSRMGAGDLPGARKMGWHGLRLGMGFMACSCITLLLFPDPILGIYSPSAELLRAAKEVLLIAAIFQLSDGAQVVATGALRGTGDTRTSAIANGVGYWVFGLPVGAYLCYHQHWGLRGIWTGLTIGLTLVAVSLVIVWARWRHSPKASPAPLPAKI